MTMNHIHLVATDVAACSAFYEEHFGFETISDHGEGVFLKDAAGFLIALDPADAPHEFPSWFHLGFLQESADAVRALHARLEAAGATIVRPLTEYDGAATVFHCADPGGTKIEVSWHRE